MFNKFVPTCAIFFCKIGEVLKGYVNKIPFFDAVYSNKDTTKKPFALSDTCLTNLYQHVQYFFVKYMDRIKT